VKCGGRIKYTLLAKEVAVHFELLEQSEFLSAQFASGLLHYSAVYGDTVSSELANEFQGTYQPDNSKYLREAGF
jgi:hypothetical protein